MELSQIPDQPVEKIQAFLRLEGEKINTYSVYPRPLGNLLEKLLDHPSDQVSLLAKRVYYPLCKLKPENQLIPVELDARVLYCLGELEKNGQKIDIVPLGLLAQSGDNRAYLPLLQFLEKCQDPFKKSLVLKYLGDYKAPEVFGILSSYLKDPDNRVVANTVEGFSRLNTDPIFPVLLQCLLHPFDRVRENAFSALQKLEEERVHHGISHCLGLSRKGLNSSIFTYIKRLNSENYFHHLFELLASEDFRYEAVEFLGEKGTQKTLYLLKQYLKQDPTHLRLGESAIGKIESRLALDRIQNPQIPPDGP